MYGFDIETFLTSKNVSFLGPNTPTEKEKKKSFLTVDNPLNSSSFTTLLQHQWLTKGALVPLGVERVSQVNIFFFSLFFSLVNSHQFRECLRFVFCVFSSLDSLKYFTFDIPPSSFLFPPLSLFSLFLFS